ncbi:MAG: hypothetical protein AAGA83_11040 [Cyanobacteria bacterium P01_F01_bin.116]
MNSSRNYGFGTFWAKFGGNQGSFFCDRSRIQILLIKNLQGT